MEWEEAKTEGRTDLNVNNTEIITNVCAWVKYRDITSAFWWAHLALSSWFSLWMSSFQGYDLNLNLSLNGEVHGRDIYSKPSALHPINAHWLHSCSPLFRSQSCGMVCSLFSLQHNLVLSEIKMYKIESTTIKHVLTTRKINLEGKEEEKLATPTE